MPRKRGGSTARRIPWGEWRATDVVRHPGVEKYLTDADDVMWTNDVFFVHVVVVMAEFTSAGIPMLHLSFRRYDRKPIRDWRQIQRMKSELCGADSEAVELFPNEERLLDGSNQYHLWVLPPRLVFPFGFQGRSVADNAIAREHLARDGIDWEALPGVQRDWGPEGMDVARDAPGVLKPYYPDWAKFQLEET